MLQFLTTVLLYLGILLACSLPVVLVARRDDYHRGVGRKFVLAGLGAGLGCGLVVASSNRLVQQCEEAGNSQCFDAGATGLVTVVIAGFVIVSVIRAYLLLTE
ncbi:MAG: hypothetical protein AAFO29_00585 [Actinomycetota bacterium]